MAAVASSSASAVSPDSPTINANREAVNAATKPAPLTEGERRMEKFEKLGQVGEGTYGY